MVEIISQLHLLDELTSINNRLFQWECNTYLVLSNNVSKIHKIIFSVPLILARLYYLVLCNN